MEEKFDKIKYITQYAWWARINSIEFPQKFHISIQSLIKDVTHTASLFQLLSYLFSLL